MTAKEKAFLNQTFFFDIGQPVAWIRFGAFLSARKVKCQEEPKAKHVRKFDPWMHVVEQNSEEDSGFVDIVA